MRKRQIDFWPVEIENDPHYPQTVEQQVRHVRIYKLYMQHYEKTYDKKACMDFCCRKFGIKPDVVANALSFTRAVIRAMKEKEEQGS